MFGFFKKSKIEIIPVINCPDFECVVRKLRIIEKFSEWAHLDIADAKFTFHRNWDEPQKWKEIGTKAKLEVHLMVEEPEREVKKWLEAGARRIIVHLEALEDKKFRGESERPELVAEFIAGECEKHGAEAGLGVNSETPVERIFPYLDKFNFFLFLAQVHPGPAGQKFLPMILGKIKTLRKEFPKAKIEVDGGINPETARAAKAAGADILTSGTFILESPDPKKAYEVLKRI